MSPYRTAAVVACRVLGLYIATWSLDSVFFLTFPFTPNKLSSGWAILSVVGFAAIPIVLAVVLWRFAPWIAMKMLADVEDGQTPSSPITLAEVQIVAISVLGLFIVFQSIPGIILASFEYFQVPGLSSGPEIRSLMGVNTLKNVATLVTKIGLGLWLFFGARGFVRVFQRFRPQHGS